MAPMQPLALRLLCEFIGTFVLVFSVGFVVLSGHALWGGVSQALVLVGGAYAFGRVSGANFNPAVSIALGASKAIGGGGQPISTMGAYVCVQLVAGIMAALSFQMLMGSSVGLGPLQGPEDLRRACLAEMLYTCVYCFLVLNVGVAKDNSPNPFYGFVIGMAALTGAYSAGSVSGGCLNPAMAIGIDVGNAGFHVYSCVFYSLAEIAGALLAVMLFRLVRPMDFNSRGGGETAELASEFIGSFVIVLTVGLNVLAASPVAGLPIISSIVSMSLALFNVSGARFNPAITLAFLTYGNAPDVTPIKAAKYVLAEILGGGCAGFAYVTISGGFFFRLCPANNYGQASVADCAFVFALCYILLSRSLARSAGWFACATGACMLIGCMLLGSLAGGMMSPAITFGAFCGEMYASGFAFSSESIIALVMLSAAELLGSVLAGRACALARPSRAYAVESNEFA